ncbi:MAG: hypothetical protein A2Y16_00095 [Tenericutes bacterium GWF2_57_13]|nr:MAG: hypothetical protein A2Y16_00095 [Tenericutes bacterium GWF2_57_13]
MKNRLHKPDVIITDFDRTITYLYRNTKLLRDLSVKIIAYYQNFVSLPAPFVDTSNDGYLVWHKIHDFIDETLHSNQAYEINMGAEHLVTEFEIEVLQQVGMLEGLVDAVIKLHHLDIRLAIVSNNSEHAIRYALRRDGIEEYFDYIGGRPFPFNPQLIKPNAYPILLAIKEMHLDGETIWYTGDDIMDMVAAKAANVIPIGIHYGRHSREQLLEYGAVICLESFVDIIRYLNPDFDM